jgi:hypothetical protein
VNFAVALKTGKCENGGILLSVKSLSFSLLFFESGRS